MPRKCAAVFCKSTYIQNNANVSFFKFPEEKDEFFAWADFCQRPEFKFRFEFLKGRPSLVLCQRHFRESDIYQNGKRNCLIKGSRPTCSKTEGTSDLDENQSAPKNIPFVTIAEDFVINKDSDFLEIKISEISDDKHLTNLESSIQGIDERLSNQPNVPEATMPSMRKDTGNHQQDGEIRKSGDTNGPPCSHYIGLIEQKAENYKLQRKIERMADDIRTLKEQLFNLEEEVKKRGVDGDVLSIKEEEEIKLEETDGIKFEEIEDFDEIT